MSLQPFVTIVMPCYNEEPYISACVESILRQTYPADKMEILIADGGSTDRSREIVAEHAARDGRVRLLDNSTHRIQSCGMNLGIRESRGQFIVIADVHAEYSSDYIAELVDCFLTTGADAAGGAQRARARTWFQRALCAALDSPLGVGGAAYRSPDREGWVDTVFPGAFRREALERVGLYDTRAITNEDAELFQRVLEAGGKVYLSSRIVVYYYPRKNLRALARQYFRYGDGRARTLLIHKCLPVFRPVIPALCVLLGIILLTVPAMQRFAPFVFALYALAALFEAVRTGRRAGALAIPVICAIFLTMHLAHGVGMIQGLIKYIFRPRPPSIEQLAPLPAACSQIG